MVYAILHKIDHSNLHLDIRMETSVYVKLNESSRLQNKAERMLRKINLEVMWWYEEQIDKHSATERPNPQCIYSREWAGGEEGTGAKGT